MFSQTFLTQLPLPFMVSLAHLHTLYGRYFHFNNVSIKMYPAGLNLGGGAPVNQGGAFQNK